MNKFLLPAFFFAITSAAQAQQGNALTTQDYERAEKFMSYNTAPFVDGGSVRPNWLPGEKFWYRNLTATGTEFILVDPV
jgi:hypothetical protein